jgi:hypothetical protein
MSTSVLNKFIIGKMCLMQRLVLLNTVLDALPTFAMGALELPAGVIAALDRLRRALLLTGTDRVSGAQ